MTRSQNAGIPLADGHMAYWSWTQLGMESSGLHWAVLGSRASSATSKSSFGSSRADNVPKTEGDALPVPHVGSRYPQDMRIALRECAAGLWGRGPFIDKEIFLMESRSKITIISSVRAIKRGRDLPMMRDPI